MHLIDILNNFAKAIATDVPMSEIEELFANRSYLFAANFGQIVGVEC